MTSRSLDGFRNIRLPRKYCADTMYISTLPTTKTYLPKKICEYVVFSLEIKIEMSWVCYFQPLDIKRVSSNYIVATVYKIAVRFSLFGGVCKYKRGMRCIYVSFYSASVTVPVTSAAINLNHHENIFCFFSSQKKLLLKYILIICTTTTSREWFSQSWSGDRVRSY